MRPPAGLKCRSGISDLMPYKKQREQALLCIAARQEKVELKANIGNFHSGIEQCALDVSARLEALAVEAEVARDYAPMRDVLEGSGLLKLRVPVEHGGFGGSQAMALQVARLLGRADGGVAQLLQPHYSFTDSIPWLPDAESRRVIYADIIAGGRIANAASERGGKHSADFSTTLRHQGDTYRIDGRKYYATGSIGAKWFTVIGLGGDGMPALAYIPADAPGMTIVDDWNGMGQAGSGSGTLLLENVAVDAGFVLPLWNEASRPLAWHESTRFIHAAIDVGIAEGALAWGAGIAANSKRVPFELPYPSLLEDPVLQYQVGKLTAQVMAAAALLERSGRLLDEVQAENAVARMPELRSALLSIKAFSADICLEASSQAFSWIGARAADRSLHSDRFWRNARTHTLHDPVRLRYQELGTATLAPLREESGAPSHPKL